MLRTGASASRPGRRPDRSCPESARIRWHPGAFWPRVPRPALVCRIGPGIRSSDWPGQDCCRPAPWRNIRSHGSTHQGVDWRWSPRTSRRPDRRQGAGDSAGPVRLSGSPVRRTRDPREWSACPGGCVGRPGSLQGPSGSLGCWHMWLDSSGLRRNRGRQPRPGSRLLPDGSFRFLEGLCQVLRHPGRYGPGSSGGRPGD